MASVSSPACSSEPESLLLNRQFTTGRELADMADIANQAMILVDSAGSESKVPISY
jgi:hypothetical protein